MLDGQNSAAMRQKLQNIFKMGILDYQFKINAEKGAIRKFLITKFDERYISVLAKMLRICITVKKEQQQAEPLEFDEDILNVNIVKFFEENGVTFDKKTVPVPMTEDEEKEFLKIFGNKE